MILYEYSVFSWVSLVKISFTAIYKHIDIKFSLMGCEPSRPIGRNSRVNRDSRMRQSGIVRQVSTYDKPKSRQIFVGNDMKPQ